MAWILGRECGESKGSYTGCGGCCFGIPDLGLSIDDGPGPDVGNGGEASGSVTSNVGNSTSPTAGNGVDDHVPKELVSVVNKQLNDTLYGLFLGKRVAYPVVENYVKNTWGKLGLINDPWLIRNVPLILKQWTPDANIIKEGVCNIPVWVKFHDFPITAFTEDGLSAIATKLGNPLMLDSYMAAMCIDS
ncbi:RNA-directed DNA polymerase, eukaryota, reverse transcriptase zinc-binding domain protein [Tanacetum coccineum]